MACTIEVMAAPAVSHAMCHNELAFIDRVVIANPGAEPLEDVTCSIEVRDVHGTLVSRGFEQQLDVPAGNRVSLDHPEVRLEPQHLATLEEETKAEITVRVALPDGPELAVAHSPLSLLAARQWHVDQRSPLLSLELLAAYVQPNHPAIAPLVSAAADRLADPRWISRRPREETSPEARRGVGGSLDTTEVSPQRIDEIVDAVIESAHQHGIHYAPPPASWGYGQKIRTPGDVIDAGVGTCLDTTVLLAAVLEHLRIAPVLWLGVGHAFLGYWRRDGHHLPDAASLQPGSAVNAVDLELMGVVETTFVTAERAPAKDVARRARQAPVDSWFRGRASDLIGVVDVAESRLMKVLPIPARRVRSDGVIEIVEYRPPDPSAAPGSGSAAGAGRPEAAEPAVTVGSKREEPYRIKRWKNSLLDLTLRNKLLNMGAASTQLPLVLPPEHLGVLGDHLQSERSVAIRALDDLTGQVAAHDAADAWALPGDVLRTMLTQRASVYSGLPQAQHRRVVERLRYRARTTLQETGANPLMVTLGRLEWQLGDRDLIAPLLLCPVDIKGVVMPFRIAFDTSGQITLNLSLMEKLHQEFGLVIPELDELPANADGTGVDVDAVVRIVREAIASAGLAFRVSSEARLAVVQFTGYLLWRDMDQHWDDFCEMPLVQHLVHTPTEPFTPADQEGDEAELDEIVAAAPVPADGSQAEAIAAVRAGRSFVLEGPPGTGKSQTITNILADQMAQGRSVLFVAEKGAALDVVRQRLGDVGLLPYTLDLHDRNARPTEVRAKLAAALKQRPQVDLEGYRANAAVVATATAALAGYAHQLHQPNAAGLSLYQARNRSLAQGEGPTLTVGQAELAAMTPEAGRAIRAACLEAVPLLGQLAADDRWAFVRRRPDPEQLLRLLAEVDRALARLGSELDSSSGAAVARSTLESARTTTELKLAGELLGGTASPDDLDEVRTSRWRNAREQLLARTQELITAASPLREMFTDTVFTMDIDPVRQELRVAEASFFLGRKGRMLRAAAPVLSCLRPGVELKAKQLPDLVEQLTAITRQHRDCAAQWQSLPGAPDVAPALLGAPGLAQLTAELDALAATAETSQQLSAAHPASADQPTLLDHARRYRRNRGRATGELVEVIGQTCSAFEAIFAAGEATEADQRRFSGSDGLLIRWQATAAARAEDRDSWAWLRRWTAAREALAPLDEALPTARDELLAGAVPPDQARQALERGIAQTTVDERWDAGGFAAFDAESHDRTASRFVTASRKLREDLRSVLPAAVVQQRPFNTEGVTAAVGRVGALEREVGRSRGGLSVRQLITKFGEVISEVTPCVLVSPDSLARFVPPGSMTFDVVVFDEASQITVPDAIGAIGRARAVVVAGDSKQMPPTSMFTDSGAGDDEDDFDPADDFVVVNDEESILSECVQAGVPRIWLSWHYRSRDESLIAFSNHQYYEGRLASFPGVPGESDDHGLSFRRVPGKFLRSRKGAELDAEADPGDLLAVGMPAASLAALRDRSLLRTNPVEAAAVVDEVLRRWQRRERSLGVVTFNIQQRSLIEQMLWESDVAGIQEALEDRTDGLFVKNLENVQGDERDVILFSTGFSANAKGVLPLNFGPLNRSGGERRLNVAITRARRRVIVFSSFDPEDMRVEQTSSVGLKHLRAYLELARDGFADDVRDGSGPAAAGSGGSRVMVDRHRDAIAAALRNRGLTVQTSLGLSDFQVDLAVGVADQPVLAVLLDSPAWGERKTTGDRDGLPTTVLSSLMGWPGVARIWLPDWIQNPRGVVERIHAAATQAAARPRQVAERWVVTSDTLVGDTDEPAAQATPPAERVSEPTAESTAEPSAKSAEPAADRPPPPIRLTRPEQPETLLEFEPFEPTNRGSRTKLDQILAPRHRGAAELITEIVDAEGPLSVERTARHLIACFGLTRLTSTREADIIQRIPPELRRDPEDKFLWPDSRDPLQWQGFRKWEGPSKERPLDEVALREIGNAMAHLTRSAMGIEKSELFSVTCRTFGGSRVTSGISDRLEAALGVAVHRGQLAVRGGIVTPPS